jgi:hypothetical protein
MVGGLPLSELLICVVGKLDYGYLNKICKKEKNWIELVKNYSIISSHIRVCFTCVYLASNKLAFYFLLSNFYFLLISTFVLVLIQNLNKLNYLVFFFFFWKIS